MSDNENYDSDDNSVKSDDSYVDKQMKTTQPKKDISMFGDDGSGDDDDNDSDNDNNHCLPKICSLFYKLMFHVKNNAKA